MSECKSVHSLLALRPDDWSADERRRVETHLATCPDCGALARAYAEQDRAIQSAPCLRLTPSQRDRLLSRTRRARRRRATRTRLAAALGTAVAVLALIALVLGLDALFRGENQPTVGGHVVTRVVGTEEPALGTASPVFTAEIEGGVDPVTGLERIGARVTLIIFSGRPDPTWLLEPAEEDVLRRKLDRLPPIEQPLDGAQAPSLGYRGLELSLPGSEGQPARSVWVFGGVVRVATESQGTQGANEEGTVELNPESQVTWLADENRALERWLLDTAAGQVQAEVLEAVRGELGATPLPSLSPPEPQGFAIYLVTDDSTSPCMGRPVLSLDDIVTYDWATHDMTLTDAAYERLAGLEILIAPGIPFVACVDAESIYSGEFWTPLSSARYDGIVIVAPPTTANRSVRIQLAYPESPELFAGEDLRGDPRILQSLETAGKLTTPRATPTSPPPPTPIPTETAPSGIILRLFASRDSGNSEIYVEYADGTGQVPRP